jgi:hypothetical protein
MGRLDGKSSQQATAGNKQAAPRARMEKYLLCICGHEAPVLGQATLITINYTLTAPRP